ncbi:DUF4826 family protein [Gallaecimonas sp. GXIMD1310]|uniref:DUF4826 family protein n=1 Tax=Gallaecimonas sp. GXIMD1310 TaxID=3131926 RepID=UPI00324F5A80
MAEEQQQPQQDVELTDEQRREMEAQWVNQCLQRANAHLASKGILPQTVRQSESRILPPYVGIWKLTAKAEGRVGDFWVISGDLPSDHVSVKTCASARDALRHFSMQWQLKAENIANGPGRTDKVQMDFANLLISRAEAIYHLYNDDRLWGDEATQR